MPLDVSESQYTPPGVVSPLEHLGKVAFVLAEGKLSASFGLCVCILGEGLDRCLQQFLKPLKGYFLSVPGKKKKRFKNA